MEHEHKPRGLYLEPSGYWKIDKVIRGERLRVSTQTRNLDEATALLRRHRDGVMRQQKGSAWECLVESMLQDHKSWLHRTAQGMTYRGRRTGKGCDMSPRQLADALLRSGGRCELSGIALSFEKIGTAKAAPFQPSIDRIDSAKGYNAANCRVVALAVNLAMREWGEEVIKRIGKAMFLRDLQQDVLGAVGEFTYPKVPNTQISPESEKTL